MNFRLEYLYPVVMFMRSVYDSYKYQGFVSQIKRLCDTLFMLLLLLLLLLLDIFIVVHLAGDLSGPSLLDGTDSTMALLGSQCLCVDGNCQNNW